MSKKVKLAFVPSRDTGKCEITQHIRLKRVVEDTLVFVKTQKIVLVLGGFLSIERLS